VDGFGGNIHVNKYAMDSYAGFMMFAGVMFAILAFIFLVLIFFFFKHLKTAINVVDASAEFLVGNKRILLVPFVYFTMTIVSFLVWVDSMAMIISLNTVVSA
jgi:hypothetical protein